MTITTLTTTRGGCPPPTTTTIPTKAAQPANLHHLPLALLHDSILTLLCNIDELLACRAVSSVLLEAVGTNPCTQLMIKGRRAGMDRGDVSGPAVCKWSPAHRLLLLHHVIAPATPSPLCRPLLC